MTSNHDQLIQPLTGRLEDHHAVLLRALLDTIDYLSARIPSLPCPDRWREPTGIGTDLVAKLIAILGVGPGTAQARLAELGPDT